MHRVIIFCARPAVLSAFYVEAFGFSILSREKTFFDIGHHKSASSRIGFHQGKKNATGAIKLCFYSDDVNADRERLVHLGVKMGKIVSPSESLSFCDGRDPEGNAFQISNRK